MKVGQLRKALNGVDDGLEILVRAFDDENDYFGTPFCAEAETGCDGEWFFAIDCGDKEDDEDAVAEEDQAAPEASKE